MKWNRSYFFLKRSGWAGLNYSVRPSLKQEKKKEESFSFVISSSPGFSSSFLGFSIQFHIDCPLFTTILSINSVNIKYSSISTLTINCAKQRAREGTWSKAEPYSLRPGWWSPAAAWCWCSESWPADWQQSWPMWKRKRKQEKKRDNKGKIS